MSTPTRWGYNARLSILAIGAGRCCWFLAGAAVLDVLMLLLVPSRFAVGCQASDNYWDHLPLILFIVLLSLVLMMLCPA